MGLYAQELTREAVFSAMQNRRTYGTSEDRMLLSVKSGHHWMGEEFSVSDPPEVDVEMMRGKE